MRPPGRPPRPTRATAKASAEAPTRAALVLPEAPGEVPPAPGWTAAETTRFNTATGNPARCHRKSCRRAGRCLGNPLRCLAERWRGRCDAARLWIRCAVAARDAGRTARAAAEAADRALLAWTKRRAGLPVTPSPWRGPAADPQSDDPPPRDPASR